MHISGVLLSGVLTLAIAGPLVAGDTQVVFSAGLLYNQGNTIDLTQKTSGGYTAEAGVLFAPENFGPKIHVYAGFAHFPASGGTDERPTFALDSTRLGMDLVYRPLENAPLSVLVGPSFHIWKGKQSGGDPSNYPSDQHIKLGWRVGLGYDLSAAWAVSLHYTFTEWRSNSDIDLGPTNPSRPAYFSLMGSYRF